MKVKFTLSARERYLEEGAKFLDIGPSTAISFIEKTETAIHRLEQFPESGQKVTELPDLQYRQIIVGDYRFFYRTGENELWIVGLWHHKQDLVNPESDS